MLTTLDFVVIGIYLVVTALLGSWSGGKQKTTTDYFLGGRDLPWWAVCFSVVATETSSLTVISVPAVAFGGALTFFQITLGYLLGRILVSVVFLPRYFRGNLSTAYAYLGERFGVGMRATAAGTFLVTRLLADGVRLFATAIPIKVVAAAAGYDPSYLSIIITISLITILYTYLGGIKAVIWMDVLQMAVYIGGALASLWILLARTPEGWWQAAELAGKTRMLYTGFDLSPAVWFTQPYVLPTAIFGGAVFSMASHGTDQLIVQRLLTCRSLRDSQVALVLSGIIVMVQFALFLFIGLLLWEYYGQVSATQLGLTRADEIFPKFIIEGLPQGISGLILAGILAAAMSTLASSLNSLSSSTVLDLYYMIRRNPRPLAEDKALRLSRGLTLFWGVVFVGFASIFESEQNPIVELGLAIASFTYGGLLGVFLLGLTNPRARQSDAFISFVVTITMMVFLIFGLWYSPADGWIIALNPSDSRIASEGLKALAWPWYTVIGSASTMVIGSLWALRHKQQPDAA